MLTTDSLGNVRAIEKVAMFESSVVLYVFFGRLGRQWVLSNDDRDGNENGKLEPLRGTYRGPLGHGIA